MRMEQITTLKQQTTQVIAAMHEHKEPILITERGLPAAYLVDVELFEKMRAQLELLQGIARGETAIIEGNTFTHDEAKERLRRWLT